METCSTSCLLALPATILPSILWLLFFRRREKHIENFRNIFGVFLWGVAVALPVVIVERLVQFIFFDPFLTSASVFASLAYGFLSIALIEEVAKYLVVKYKAMPYDFFDEAQDAILYMVTAALGFAAIENLVYALSGATTVGQVLQISLFRGITATFLHAVASGTIGYFLALSLENPRERKKFLYTGILLGTVLHGIYNNFIIDIQTQLESAQAVGGLFVVIMIAAFLSISGIIIMIALKRLANVQLARKKQ